ncbi:hypothetical protein LDENG_00196690, partial [Lucifuga dentata]
INDLEGRSRRLNLRFVRIAEGEEKGQTTSFLGELIPQLLGRENFSKPVKVDRARQSLQPKPGVGEKPHTIIARMHYAWDKEYILKLYHQKAPVFYKGSRVFIYNDYTVDVLTQRPGKLFLQC